jgi:outer membrane translocation and assembly module TamA
VRAVVRTRVRLSPKQDARARLVGGSTLDGTLPPQKLWYLGGISTLRGEDFKERQGDQFLLANAEYYVLVRRNVWGFGFLDWGSAWFGKDNIDRQQFLLDGGLGVRIGQGPLALTAARNLQETHAAIHVLVRFSETF